LKTAGLVLDPAGVARPGDQSETWEKVLRQLACRERMPPQGAPRPPPAFYTRAAGYLARELEASAATQPNPGSLPLAHRLTRTEYANVVRDLLALPDLPKELDYATLLPADNASSGFDNLADTLFVSPATMERYLAAALKISRVAVGDPDMGALVNTHITPVRQTQDGRNEALPFGTRGGLQIDGYFALDAEYEFKVEIAGAGAEVHQLEITIDGERKAITNISRRPGVPATRMRPNNQGVFRFAVPAGPRRVGVAFVERSEALSEAPLRPPGRNRGALPSVVSVTITGPFNDDRARRHTKSSTAVCLSTGEHRPGVCMRGSHPDDAVAPRLPPKPSPPTICGRVRQFYDAGRAERDFDRGIQRALERVLVSPAVPVPHRAGSGRRRRRRGLSASAISSSRHVCLSFSGRAFPTTNCSMPRPRNVAQAGRSCRRQVTRMLADPRSRSLVTELRRAWLFLRDVETKEPDLYLFRDFDEGLRAAFVRETELFLDSILRPSTDTSKGQGAPSTVEGRENRSVLELLTADYTFLNEPLAKHYGIPQVTGSHFRRVTLPKGSPRRGLLGQGSILSITSYSTRTSAVLRGKYVLENLLASPPPPPPAMCPSLNTERSGKPLSMKEAMQLHRASPACAGCHAKMDPIGFALESFDALGRYRAEENGRPIEVTARCRTGRSSTASRACGNSVLRDPALFVEALTGKLLMYALTRNIQHYDQPTIRVIARESARQNYTFASLGAGRVNSAPFQSRRRQAATQ
jgi:hypothetical protein